MTRAPISADPYGNSINGLAGINPRTRAVLDRLGSSNVTSMTRDYHFRYSGFALNVPQNTSAQINIKIDGGVDFVVKQITGRISFPTGGGPTGAVDRMPALGPMVGWDFAAIGSTLLVGLDAHHRIQIQSNNRPWYNIPVPWSLAVGDRDNPVWLPDEVLVAGNDTLLIDVFNDSPALTGQTTPAFDYFVSLVGIKLGRS